MDRVKMFYRKMFYGECFTEIDARAMTQRMAVCFSLSLRCGCDRLRCKLSFSAHQRQAEAYRTFVGSFLRIELAVNSIDHLAPKVTDGDVSFLHARSSFGRNREVDITKRGERFAGLSG